MSVYAIPAVDAVLAVASALLAVRESGSNSGRFVNYIQRYGGGKDGEPWCSYFIYFVAHHALRSAWPLPRTGSCDILLRDAERQGLVVENAVRGGLFFVMNKDNTNDAVHVGFVDEVKPERGPHAFYTCEGNSNEMGSREGVGVFHNLRGMPDDHRPYVFADWEQALRRPP